MKAKRIFILFTLTIIAALLFSSAAFAGGTGWKVKSKILVQGAPIHGANGLYFSPDGKLYIASAMASEIVVMNPDSGEILEVIGQDRGVLTPDDLTFGPDGALYWTAIMVGLVQKMTPDGAISVIASDLLGANPITFSDDGRLFIARDIWGTGLYEIDPNGVNPPRVILPDLANLNGFDFGPDGLLYGPIFTDAKIVRIDVDTGEMTTVVDMGISFAAVKFDTQGRLVALAIDSSEVMRFDLQTGAVAVLARLKPGLDNLAIDAQGWIFVSNWSDGSIEKIRPDGKARTLSPGGLIMPGGVAVLPNGRGGETVWVADFWNLRGYDSKSKKMVGEVSAGVVSGLAQPFTASVDGENLVVTSAFNMGVQVIDPEAGAVLESYVDPNIPLNAIRFQGDLVVAEALTGQVVKLTPGGNETLGQFIVPAGLLATDDDLWVGDYAAGVIYLLVRDGELLATPEPVISGLAGPEGLAFAPDGNLLVVESGAGRLSHIDLATGAVTPLLEGLQFGAYFPTPISDLNGVAVGPSGAIYVTSDKADVVYKIILRK